MTGITRPGEVSIGKNNTPGNDAYETTVIIHYCAGLNYYTENNSWLNAWTPVSATVWERFGERTLLGVKYSTGIFHRKSILKLSA